MDQRVFGIRLFYMIKIFQGNLQKRTQEHVEPQTESLFIRRKVFSIRTFSKNLKKRV